jgi:hypothetical protein
MNKTDFESGINHFRTAHGRRLRVDQCNPQHLANCPRLEMSTSFNRDLRLSQRRSIFTQSWSHTVLREPPSLGSLASRDLATTSSCSRPPSNLDIFHPFPALTNLYHHVQHFGTREKLTSSFVWGLIRYSWTWPLLSSASLWRQRRNFSPLRSVRGLVNESSTGFSGEVVIIFCPMPCYE